MTLTLPHPEYFTVTGPGGQALRGGDQDWYRDPWQRRAGCGPTTAAALLTYLGRACPGLAALAPRGRGQGEFLAHMEALWSYATPGSRGLDKAEALALGCRSFALSRGCRLGAAVLDIPPLAAPLAGESRDFLRTALANGRPVAFLNFDNGQVENLYHWHWVPLIAMETAGERVRATILDECREHVIDFSLWLETTKLGGALVCLWPEG